ncbi:MAG: outer membrane protein assembly factor BamD [Gemmatimonadales bacterium]
MRPVVLWSVLLLAACHHVEQRPAGDAAGQFADAMRLFRHGEFADAQSGFQRIQFDLPVRDTLQARVRFYLAECYAGQGELITAIREFRRVADDYPADPLAPVSLMRIGDSYGQLWRRPELDPSNGQTAIATYQELVGRYPDAPATRIAAQRVRDLQEKFAQKDYASGLFYFKRNAFDSAILYFRGLIVQYPSSSVVPDAYIRLAQAYKAISYREELRDVCDHLNQNWGGRRDVRQVCGNGSPGR